MNEYLRDERNIYGMNRTLTKEDEQYRDRPLAKKAEHFQVAVRPYVDFIYLFVENIYKLHDQSVKRLF